jgi:hypothetical protein
MGLVLLEEFIRGAIDIKQLEIGIKNGLDHGLTKREVYRFKRCKTFKGKYKVLDAVINRHFAPLDTSVLVAINGSSYVILDACGKIRDSLIDSTLIEAEIFSDDGPGISIRGLWVWEGIPKYDHRCYGGSVYEDGNWELRDGNWRRPNKEDNWDMLKEAEWVMDTIKGLDGE